MERTGFTTADVPPYTVPQLVTGVQESSLQAAQRYVANLVASQKQITCAQNPFTSGCSTTPTTVPVGGVSATTMTGAP